MKIACDVGVSNRSIKFLKSKGFDIVYKAGAGQPDEEWFAMAMHAGADVFVSGDLDIARLVETVYDQRIKWINFPNMPYNEGKANEWLFDRLVQLQKVWGL